jgi:hypothetical protein
MALLGDNDECYNCARMHFLMRKSVFFVALTLAVPIVLLPAGRREYSNELAETSFPSDTELPGQLEIASMLEAVCPGRIVTGEGAGCRGDCPEYTAFSGEDMTREVVGVTLGHFLSPTSDDAAVSVRGCEPHIMNFGGTVLVTRRSGRWSMLWYKAGVDTSRCRKVSLRDHREILVCIGEYGGQGNIWTALYVEDLSSPKPALMADGREFFTAYDNTQTCGESWDGGTCPLVRSHIHRVEFKDSANGDPPAILVSASYGRKATTPAVVSACMNGQTRSLPRTRDHRIEFIFDGHDYRPAPSSVGEARIFARQSTCQ